MVEIVWEFIVKEKARGQFELAYGPGGVLGILLGALAVELIVVGLATLCIISSSGS